METFFLVKSFTMTWLQRKSQLKLKSSYWCRNSDSVTQLDFHDQYGSRELKNHAHNLYYRQWKHKAPKVATMSTCTLSRMEEFMVLVNYRMQTFQFNINFYFHVLHEYKYLPMMSSIDSQITLCLAQLFIGLLILWIYLLMIKTFISYNYQQSSYESY